MGYLTTITFYNDGLHLIKDHPEDFANKVYSAAIRGRTQDFGLGSFANFAKVQRGRHADDHTTYVHMGNCVTEVNPYSDEFKDLIKHHPQFAEDLVEFLETEVENLKRRLKEAKAASVP